MPPETVEAFTREHMAMLEREAPPSFTVPHQIVYHVYESIGRR